MRLLKQKRVTRSFGGNLFSGLVLLLLGIFMALPLVYVVSASLKPFDEIFTFPPKILVRNPTLDNFTDLFILCSNSLVAFSRYIFNSLFITVTATFLHVIFASMAAYPLAKNQFPFKDVIFGLVVTCLLFVPQVTAVPSYIIMSKLHWINTYAAQIFPTIGGSMGLFLMKQFMESLPTSMMESARLEGANEFRIFYRIIMPNVKPAWLTLIIFVFQSLWNVTSSTVVYDEQLKTLQIAMTQFYTGAGIARMGVTFAALVILMVLPIGLFIALQSRVIETMAFAGIKE